VAAPNLTSDRTYIKSEVRSVSQLHADICMVDTDSRIVVAAGGTPWVPYRVGVLVG